MGINKQPGYVLAGRTSTWTARMSDREGRRISQAYVDAAGGRGPHQDRPRPTVAVRAGQPVSAGGLAPLGRVARPGRGAGIATARRSPTSPATPPRNTSPATSTLGGPATAAPPWPDPARPSGRARSTTQNRGPHTVVHDVLGTLEGSGSRSRRHSPRQGDQGARVDRDGVQAHADPGPLREVTRRTTRSPSSRPGAKFEKGILVERDKTNDNNRGSRCGEGHAVRGLKIVIHKGLKVSRIADPSGVKRLWA
jgi:hypothetical protein